MLTAKAAEKENKVAADSRNFPLTSQEKLINQKQAVPRKQP